MTTAPAFGEQSAPESFALTVSSRGKPPLRSVTVNGFTMSWAYGGGLLEIQYCEPEPPDMSIPPRYTPRAGS
ncbi:hypothetical protein [Streptomyces sp. NPDC005955]|uniref:hypothetical protein n=1 Tax=Streptomyces sp. NPDC005955 TaxID=3364738 RepID=UPI0036CCFC50